MTFSIKGIDHIQLAAPVNCEEAARNFFKGILGMEEIEKPDSLKKNGGVWFSCGAQEIHIGVEEGFQPAKKAHPAIEVIHLHALMTVLDKHNITYKEDDRLPHANRLFVEDPFGNRLEILEMK